MIKLIEERTERSFAAIYEERTSYDDKLYSQKDSFVMGSTLRPLIAGILMVDLERNVIQKLSTHMTK